MNALAPAAVAPSSLAPEVLARRLCELAGDERQVQVDFLLHLDEFDRRRAFLEAGYDSLWTYCLRALHLREGPAGRRIGAMRVLRRFPTLESALRDGRLCLSTVTLLGPLLTEANLEDLVARAAYRTKAEVEQLAAAVHPRSAPRDGVRKLRVGANPDRDPASARVSSAAPVPASAPVPESVLCLHPTHRPGPPTLLDALPDERESPANQPAPAKPVAAAADGAPQATSALSTTVSAPAASIPQHFIESGALSPPGLPTRDARRAAELRPTSRDQWSLRVTLDATLKEELETLTALLSHTARGDLAAVLREAVRCGIEKHGKRRGAVKPPRERPSSRNGPLAPGRRAIPAAVRREVWNRMLCRRHNLLHAEQVFGREHMDRFATRPLIPG